MGNFAARRHVATDEKRRIGQAAAAMVQPDQVVILDGGTTAVQIARHLPAELRATVVTHSPTLLWNLLNIETLKSFSLGKALQTFGGCHWRAGN